MGRAKRPLPNRDVDRRSHGARVARHGAAFVPRLETLEDRLLLAVSAQAQHFVYLLNRARHDPAAYEDEVGLPDGLLDGVAARPPLAINAQLFASSEFHADEMATYNYFGHQSQVTSDWPNKMARDQGYDLPAYFVDDANYIESLAAGYNTGINPDPYSHADEPLRALILDDGINPPGHRNHLLGIDSFNADNREIGVGYAYNAATTYRNYWAIHATRSDPSDTFLTGVVFDDANGNARYDMNEGLSGVTVVAGGFQVATGAMGGWSIEVTPGTYTVTASGGTFVGTSLTTVMVGAENMEIDFLSGQPGPMVNFQAVAAPDRIGVHRLDRFFLDGNGNGFWDAAPDGDGMVRFGVAGDMPLAGDWNGDGTDEIGVHRGDRFYLDANGNGRWDGENGGDRVERFGAAGDTPLVGDWNGDGTDTIGVHRGDRFFLDVNGSGTWDGSVGGDSLVQFGAVGDQPVVGNWNGAGGDQIGVHRGGVFFLDANANHSWDGTAGGDAKVPFGAVGDEPVVGDWNGDGSDALGVHRGGRFFLDFNGNQMWDGLAAGDSVVQFGATGDRGLAGRWTVEASAQAAPMTAPVDGVSVLTLSAPSHHRVTNEPAMVAERTPQWPARLWGLNRLEPTIALLARARYSTPAATKPSASQWLPRPTAVPPAGERGTDSSAPLRWTRQLQRDQQPGPPCLECGGLSLLSFGLREPASLSALE